MIYNLVEHLVTFLDSPTFKIGFWLIILPILWFFPKFWAEDKGNSRYTNFWDN